MYDKTKVKAFSSIRLKYLCDITTGNKDTKNRAEKFHPIS